MDGNTITLREDSDIDVGWVLKSDMDLQTAQNHQLINIKRCDLQERDIYNPQTTQTYQFIDGVDIDTFVKNTLVLLTLLQL